MPNVSILLPTYNYAKYLPFSLESILNQTYSNYEVIVSDDASKDDTDSVINKYKPKFKGKLKFSQNKINLGPPKNFNLCLKKTRGKYIVFFHPDDILYPDFLKKSIEVLENKKNIGVVFSASKLIDNNGKQIGSHFSSKFKKGKVKNAKKKLLFGNLICFTSAMAKKDLGLNLNENLSQLCDWELWIRLENKTDFYFLPKLLSSYRVHGKSHTQKIFQNLPELIKEKEITLSKIKSNNLIFQASLVDIYSNSKNMGKISIKIAFLVSALISRFGRLIYW